MGEAIYKYTGKGRKKKKTQEAFRRVSGGQKKALSKLKKSKKFQKADRAGKVAMLKKSGYLGDRGKANKKGRISVERYDDRFRKSIAKGGARKTAYKPTKTRKGAQGTIATIRKQQAAARKAAPKTRKSTRKKAKAKK